MWLIANFKDNFSTTEVLDWLGKIGPKLSFENKVKIVICPDFLSIEEIKKEIMVGRYPILIGAQDLSPFSAGSFTGEESAEHLKQFIDLVILGHSERRANFGETDQLIREKTKRAVDLGITPVVCVQSNETPIPLECKVVAYEPIFAIGTGVADTPQNANEVAISLKKQVEGVMEVLYGGSVNAENIKAFMEQENIDGVLVGKAALNTEEFLKMLEVCNEL